MSENFSYQLTRTYNVPVAKVWAAWTTPDQYEKWAYCVPGSVSQDLRPGGAWKATVVTPDGQEFPLSGSYLEVVENERLVVGMDVPGADKPAVMTLELSERDGQTEVTLSQATDTAEERDQAEEGSGMLLESLGSFLTP